MSWFTDAIAFLVKGGPVMVPLILCSIIALAVSIERFFKMRAAITDVTDLCSQVDTMLYRGDSEKAVKKCESSGTPVGSVLAAGIRARKSGTQGAERAMEEQAQKEIAGFQVRLGFLDTIITIAPLLGLLGTVTGMIRSFHVISSKSGMSAPTAITGGVAEALIATAAGLAIAIFSVVVYNYLNEKIKRAIETIETSATHLVNTLAEIEERRNEIKPLSA